LQADPLGLVDGASIYGYVKQNPGRWVDPRGLWTGNVGVSGSASWGPWGFTFGFGFAVDGCGNIAFYYVYSPYGGPGIKGRAGGGPKSVGGGGLPSGSAGVAVGGSNAKTVCYLEGPFNNVSFGLGFGTRLGGGAYTGDSTHGRVTGGEAVYGVGVGAGGWAGPTETGIIPLNTNSSCDCNC
jgi:hypothetical protein